MYLEIVSPEATLYSGDVTSVAVPSVDGEFEMLNNHAAIVAILKEGHVKIFGNITLADNVASKFTKAENRQGFYLPINSGTVEMKDNKVIVLVD
jgi:F-type H+-transporting ATPase subunit epsilon